MMLLSGLACRARGGVGHHHHQPSEAKTQLLADEPALRPLFIHTPSSELLMYTFSTTAFYTSTS